jgi:hypothetical protein
MASLIDEFNESVKYFDAQDDNEWQHKAVKSLCKKFKLLAAAADKEEEVTELVHGMGEFFQNYLGLTYKEDPGYEEIDETTKDIDLMACALFTVAKRGMLPEGSSKAVTRLAAEIHGRSEQADTDDSFEAWQAQGDKVAEIAESMRILEPVSSPSPAPQPADAGNAANPKKSAFTL